MASILGLDVGQRKIGVAIGQTDTKLAFVRPALLVEDWTEAWPLIIAMVANDRVGAIVVGLPLNTDGTEGAQAHNTRKFVAELHSHVAVPIHLRDERFTTTAVHREQGGQKLDRGQEDSLAAQLLLESYLQESHESS